MTLTTLRDRVELRLSDSGNAIWATGLIDAGIKLALHEYSQAVPRVIEASITFSSATRELDISSLSNVLDIRRVWTPYNSSSPEHPPYWRYFDWWRDLEIIYFPDNDEPQNNDVCRIFYGTLHTIDGLDSASATTIKETMVSWFEIGAAGFAAQSRSLDLTEQVVLSRSDIDDIGAWGLERLVEFRAALEVETQTEAVRRGGRIELPPLDRWDKSDDWS